MVIGGELRCDRGEVERLERASTEPPMVIGGEVQTPRLIWLVLDRLQRSRRW